MNATEITDPPTLELGSTFKQISELSKFEDDVWRLDSFTAGKPGTHTIIWSSCILSDGRRLTDPAYARLLLSCKTFLSLCIEGKVSRKGMSRASMAYNIAFNLRQFLVWMTARGVFSFEELTEQHIVSYRNYVRRRKARKKIAGGGYGETEKSLSPHSKVTALLAVRYLVALGSDIPGGPRLDPIQIEDILANSHGGTEKATERIPDDLFIPLVNLSINYIAEIAPKVLERDALFIAYRTSLRFRNRGRNYAGFYADVVPTELVTLGGEVFDLAQLTFREHQRWMIHIMTACFIVIAGLTGMRASEILSLRSGCLSSLSVSGSKKLLKLSGILYKTSPNDLGEAAEWVAGWDEPSNPVRLAVEMLEQLCACRAIHDDHLFSDIRVGRTTVGYGRASVQFNANLFAKALNLKREWHFAPHQFRKTFARFVALSSPNAAVALMRHFKHVSMQMTERYFPTDPELMDEIMEAALELAEERIAGILGSDRLAGIKGEQILARNSEYRGVAGAAERKRMTQLTMLDPNARLLLHVYGVCVYDEATAKCEGKLVNVGLNMCSGCSNLVIDESHLPFWLEEYSALGGTIAEIVSFGGKSDDLEVQLAFAADIIMKLTANGSAA